MVDTLSDNLIADVSDNDKYVLIKVIASLNSQTSKRLKEIVKEKVANGAANIVFNLELVEFMDSFALGELVSILKLINNSNGKLFLLNIQPYIKQLFDITQLKTVFNICSDINEIKNRI